MLLYKHLALKQLAVPIRQMLNLASGTAPPLAAHSCVAAAEKQAGSRSQGSPCTCSHLSLVACQLMPGPARTVPWAFSLFCR